MKGMMMRYIINMLLIITMYLHILGLVGRNRECTCVSANACELCPAQVAGSPKKESPLCPTINVDHFYYNQ